MSARKLHLGVVLATLASLAMHFAGLGFMLPAHPQHDEKVLWLQLQIARERGVSSEEALLARCYPDLLGHVADLVVPEPRPREPGDMAALERNAAHDVVWLRGIVALLASLLVPGTYFVARRFLEARLALAAAVLASVSTLVSWYGSMARPHVVLAAFVTLTVAAALRAREKGRVRDFALAGLCGALAVGTLQSGACVAPAILAAWWLGERPRFGRPLVGLALAAAFMAASVQVFLHSDPLPEAGAGRGGLWNDLLSWFGMGVHNVDAGFFDGEGFLRLWTTARDHEPVLAIGVVFGVAAFVLRRVRREGPIPRAVSRSALVVGSHTLVHLVLFGWYGDSFQRMWLPIVPAAAILAVHGANATIRVAHGRTRWVVVSVWSVLALLQLGIAGQICVLRARDSTLDLATRWIGEHPEAEPLYLGQTIDVTIVPRDPRHREWMRESRLYLLPWDRACAALEPAERERFGRDLRNVPLEAEAKRRQLAEDPARYVAELGRGFVLLERVSGSWRRTFFVLREALLGHARFVTSIPAARWEDVGAGPVHLFDGPLADDRWFWWRVLTVARLGPPIDVFELQVLDER